MRLAAQMVRLGPLDGGSRPGASAPGIAFRERSLTPPLCTPSTRDVLVPAILAKMLFAIAGAAVRDVCVTAVRAQEEAAVLGCSQRQLQRERPEQALPSEVDGTVLIGP